MNILMRTGSEACISFIVGGIPTYIIYKNDSSKVMIESLARIAPSDEIVKYLFILFIIHVSIYALLKLTPFFTDLVAKFRIGREKLHAKRKSDEMLKFTHDIGFSIHSIYRAITGAVPVAILILIGQVGADGSLATSLLSILTFILMLSACVFLSWFNDVTRLKDRYMS